MSPQDISDTLRDNREWFLRNAKEAIDSLNRRAAAELHPEAQDALYDTIQAMEAALTDTFDPLISKVIEDFEPEIGQEPRREHGTYFTSNGMRAA